MRRIWIGPETKLLRIGGRPPRTTLRLLALQAGLFALYILADGPAWVRRHLVLSAAGLFARHELWQPLTALWLHLELRTLLLDLAVLWLLGAPLERAWGGRRLLGCYLASGSGGLLAGGVIGLLRPAAWVCGATGASAALLAAAAVAYPQHLLLWRQHALGVRVRPTALIAGAALLLSALLDRAWLALGTALVGAAIGLLYSRPRPRWGPLLARWWQRHRRRGIRAVGRPSDRSPYGPN